MPLPVLVKMNPTYNDPIFKSFKIVKVTFL